MTDSMNQVEMRAEVEAQGLITYGDSAKLEQIRAEDNTRGVFWRELTSMSEQHLRQLCIFRSIPSTGNRQKLIEKSKNKTSTSENIGSVRRGKLPCLLDCPRRMIGWANPPEKNYRAHSDPIHTWARTTSIFKNF